jgi:hypothetical protein
MPSTIICPNCRRSLEESGRLTCPDCSAILPSNHSAPVATATQARPVSAAASALDEFTIPQRPTGAMTLLRNDLRSDDKSKPQSGWLDNIMPAKKPKEPTETEIAPKPRAIREAIKPAAPVDHSPAIDSKPLPKSVPASVPARSELTPVRVQTPSSVQEPDLHPQVPIIGLVVGAIFCLLAALALLQGKDGLLGTLVLLTAGILGASILAIWQREAEKKAFWQGFAVFGLLYLSMAFIPAFPDEAGLELPTARLFRIAHAKIVGTPEDPRSSFAIMKGQLTMAEAPADPQAGGESPESGAPSPRTASFFAPGDVRQFTVVGNCCCTLGFALFGSALATWFHRSRLAA